MRVALETEAIRLSVDRLAPEDDRRARRPAGGDGALRRGQGLRALARHRTARSTAG